MVDQIEFHPGYTQVDTVLYCQRNNITVKHGVRLETDICCSILFYVK